jgi:GntR family transcriptional regulator
MDKRRREKRGKPLYIRTAERLEGILEGMEPGSFLPSEPKLAQQLGVSRATLREAMRPFEQQGLIVRQQGVGTYVADPPKVIESGLEVLESIESMAARIGLEVQMGELEINRRPATAEEGEDFGTELGAAAIEISRLMLAQGRPVAYLVDVLPEGVIPPESLQGDFTGSLLDLLLRLGEPELSHSRTEITAISAPADIGRALGIQRGDVLLRLRAELFKANGGIICRSVSYFLSGIFRFHVNRQAQPSVPGRH